MSSMRAFALLEKDEKKKEKTSEETEGVGYLSKKLMACSMRDVKVIHHKNKVQTVLYKRLFLNVGGMSSLAV